MERETVLDYFSSQGVVQHYAEATVRLGLWKSEALIFQRLFKPEDTLLELGCGCGRISFALAELGYRNLLAVDYSKPMIQEARVIGRRRDQPVHFRVGDATRLEYEDNLFDGAIFGFNGLMQIPGNNNRFRAMKEIYRVLSPGAWFVFTAHDRDNPKFKAFWSSEKSRWRRGKQDPALDDFGDRFEATPLGDLFIHVPSNEELRKALKEAGFRIEVDVLRSVLANESPAIREFSDDTRFWVVQKQTASGE